MSCKLIVANWKMNVSLKEARELAREIDAASQNLSVEVVICPPFTHLGLVAKQLTCVHLGAQDLFWENTGPYTGEISPLTLKELGCEYVVVGHSERRIHLQETDLMIQRKIKAALANALRPILCVGEKKEERDAGKTLKVVKGQLTHALEETGDPKGLIVSYEPVWAIGTNRPVSWEALVEATRFIRDFMEERFNPKTARKIQILYGGSVSPENVLNFLQKGGADGVLLGGASLDVAGFMNIVQQSQNIQS